MKLSVIAAGIMACLSVSSSFLSAETLPQLGESRLYDVQAAKSWMNYAQITGGAQKENSPFLDSINVKTDEIIKIHSNFELKDVLTKYFPAHLHVTFFHAQQGKYYQVYVENETRRVEEWNRRVDSLRPFATLEDKKLAHLSTPIFEGSLGLAGNMTVTPLVSLANGRLIVRPDKGIVLQVNQSPPSVLQDSVTLKSGFLPNPNGFGFINGFQGQEEDLTAEDIALLLGRDEACYVTPSGGCVLKAGAEQFRKKILKESTDGSCYGMSVSSMMLYKQKPFRGKMTLADFDPHAKQTIDLQVSAMRNMLLFYQTSQEASSIAIHLEARQTPSQVLQTVIDRLNTDDPIAVIGIHKRDTTGGHAITPYAVEDFGNGEFRIYVYDNNYPDDASRFVLINRNTETWSYKAQINPSAPVQLYDGDLSTVGNIQAIPLSVHFDFSPIVFDKKVAEFQFSGHGLQMLIENMEEKRIGYDFEQGKHINEIAEAEMVPSFNVGAPPTYSVPISKLSEDISGLTEDQKFEAYFQQMFGVTLGALSGVNERQNSSFFMRSGNSVAEVGNINLLEQETFEIAVHPSADLLMISSSSLVTQQPFLKLVVDNADSQSGYIYEISDLNLVQGTDLIFMVNDETMELNAMSASQKDNVDFQPLDASSYSLRVYKKSAQGQATARRAHIELPTGGRQTLRVTDWIDDGATPRSRRAETDDYGTIEVLTRLVTITK